MEQTRIESLVEVSVNILIGFGVSFLMNWFIIPAFFPEVVMTLGANFFMGVAYTVVSAIRSYIIRRWFNAGIHKMVKAIAAGLYNRLKGTDAIR